MKEARIKLTENKDETWDLYNQTEKRFIIKNGTKKEVEEIKKEIDRFRRNQNNLKKGVR